MAPQGLSLSASLTSAFSVSIVPGSQRTFCLLPSLDRVLARLMSRGDELRQLAAQLSVLAALEDSIAVGLSRVMGPASPDRGAASPTSGSPLVPAARAVPAVSAPAPSPSREVAASLLRSASLRASSPRTRTRSRSPAPLPKRAPRAPRRSSSVASGLRGSVALAESGLVTGLTTKSCPPVPPPQLRLSRVARALHAASTESQPPAVASGSSVPTAPAPEAPRATEPSSNSDDEWDALLDAHGLTGTAAAVAQPAVAAGASRRARDKRRRRQQSAPIAGLSTSWPMCSRWWACSGSVPALVDLVILSALAFSPMALGVSGTARRLWRGPWHSSPFGFLALSVESTRVARLLWHALPRLVWWPSHLAKRSHGCWACCSWTSPSCSSVRRLLVVS